MEPTTPSSSSSSTASSSTTATTTSTTAASITSSTSTTATKSIPATGGTTINTSSNTNTNFNSTNLSMEDKRKVLEKKFMENRPQLAFAKLVGKLVDNIPFECLITQLPAELGRGPITFTSVSGRVCLGEQKAISRQHAKITWNSEKNDYELTCLGKNGMFAAGKLVAKDQTIDLVSKMPLKIGGARLYFLKALKSPCSNLSGFKMLSKIYHRGSYSNEAKALTCEEMIDQILEMFPKSEQDLGGKQNLQDFVIQYVQVDKEHFIEEIDSKGMKRYRMVKVPVLINQEENNTNKKRSTTNGSTGSSINNSSSSVNSSSTVAAVDTSSKKQKV